MRAAAVGLALILMATAVTATGCAPQRPVAADACRRADAVVVWTSTSDAVVEFYRGTTPVGAARAPGAGNMFFQQAVGRDGKGRLVLVSPGGPGQGKVRALRVDPADCRVTSRELDAVPLGWAVAGEHLYTMGCRNGACRLQDWDDAGHSVREQRLRPGLLAGAVAVTGDRVLVSVTDPRTDKGWLVEFDAASLTRLRELPLPAPLNSASEILVLGGTAYLATAAGRDGPAAAIAVADLASGQVTRRELGEPLPYVLRAHGGDVIVGHTFLNPAFGPLRDKRAITVVPPDGQPRGAHLRYGHWHLEIDGDDLLALGMADDDHFHLTRYRLSDFGVTSETSLTRPVRGDYFPGVVAVLRPAGANALRGRASKRTRPALRPKVSRALEHPRQHRGPGLRRQRGRLHYEVPPAAPATPFYRSSSFDHHA